MEKKEACNSYTTASEKGANHGFLGVRQSVGTAGVLPERCRDRATIAFNLRITIGVGKTSFDTERHLSTLRSILLASPEFGID